MENKKSNKKNKIIWLSAFILSICVVSSSIYLASVLNDFQPADSGAISLIPADSSPSDPNSGSSQTTEPTDNEPTANPGFEVSDNQKKSYNRKH